MKECTCARLPQVLRGDEGNLPCETLTRVANTVDGWGFIYQCKVCGQSWRVDRFDKLQVNLSFKMHDQSDWTELDDRAMRIGYLIRSRGGNGDEMCQWVGCNIPALKSLAFCANHAYGEMSLRE